MGLLAVWAIRTRLRAIQHSAKFKLLISRSPTGTIQGKFLASILLSNLISHYLMATDLEFQNLMEFFNDSKDSF